MPWHPEFSRPNIQVIAVPMIDYVSVDLHYEFGWFEAICPRKILAGSVSAHIFYPSYNRDFVEGTAARSIELNLFSFNLLVMWFMHTKPHCNCTNSIYRIHATHMKVSVDLRRFCKTHIFYFYLFVSLIVIVHNFVIT